MNTVIECLKGVNAYPIPLRTIEEIAERRGLSLNETANQVLLSGRNYNLALADLLLWLSRAPDISQGGQSFSFTDEQRKDFREGARALLRRFGDSVEAEENKPVYGYKGNRL